MSISRVPASFGFDSLPNDVLGKILNFTGELSNVAKVCKMFKKQAVEESESVLKKAEERYGSRILTIVFSLLPYTGHSRLAKIEALFHWAKTRSRLAGTMTKPLTNSPYDASHLKEAIDPYQKYLDLYALWRAIYSEVPHSLKAEMYAIRLDPYPIASCEQMRVFLKSHQSELTKVKNLNLKNADLKELPEEISLLKRLNSLDLSGNHLKSLPDLSSLEELGVLNLNNNEFCELPNHVGKIPELQVLILSNNNLVRLDESITELSNLKLLALSGNQLTFLPKTLGKLSSLQQLSADNNFLMELPQTISGLKSLMKLYLHNNRLSEIPESIAKLKSLKILSATQNQITSLPNEIGTLPKLHALMLDQNLLTHLPSSIAQLQNLSLLSVSNNLLTSVPDFPSIKCVVYEGNPCLCDPDLPESSSISKGLKTKEEFLQVYNKLGLDKWKECIDGMCHSYGKFVFDQGLHGGAIEPGYLKSMENLFEFLKENFGRRIDADFYLQMHKIACAHFNGAKTETLIDQKGIGQFRNHGVQAHFGPPGYKLTAQGDQDLKRMNSRLSSIMGPSFALGEFSQKDSMTWTLRYQSFKKEEIRIIFNLFVGEFYSEIASAKNTQDYLRAIAKLIQHLEWLHPPRDGTGRVDIALLNFLLASYEGLNPALLMFPYVSSCFGLEEWITYLTNSMKVWDQEANNLSIN
jgi:hypothetical protein